MDKQEINVNSTENTQQFMWAGSTLFVILIICIIGPYIYQFYGPLSDKQETFGWFGDYVGGILNPILSFISFMFVLHQWNETRKREIMQEQENQKMLKHQQEREEEGRRQYKINLFLLKVKSIDEKINGLYYKGFSGIDALACFNQDFLEPKEIDPGSKKNRGKGYYTTLINAVSIVRSFNSLLAEVFKSHRALITEARSDHEDDKEINFFAYNFLRNHYNEGLFFHLDDFVKVLSINTLVANLHLDCNYIHTISIFMSTNNSNIPTYDEIDNLRRIFKEAEGYATQTFEMKWKKLEDQ